jgi:hypothetical protein
MGANATSNGVINHANLFPRFRQDGSSWSSATIPIAAHGVFMEIRETTLWDHPPTLTLRKPDASGNLESGYARRAERSLSMSSGGDRPWCRAVANVYTERLRSTVSFSELGFGGLF